MIRTRSDALVLQLRGDEETGFGADVGLRWIDLQPRLRFVRLLYAAT